MKPWGFRTALLLGLCLPVWAQWTIGLGGSYTLPTGQHFSSVNRAYPSATLALLNRRFCHWWYGFHLEYGILQRKPGLDSTRISFKDAKLLSAELRWFPWLPTHLPLYVAGRLNLTDIGYTPRNFQVTQQTQAVEEPSPLGVGISLSVGYLLFYSSHCCPWFLDLAIGYQSYNGIWRSDQRPHISGFGFFLRGFVQL